MSDLREVEKARRLRPNRAPGTIWGFRRGGEDYVRTLDGDRILIHVTDATIRDEVGMSCIVVSRKDARLLAKRLTECLDGTAAS